MAAVPTTVIPFGVSRVRRYKDRAFTSLLWLCGALAMLPLLFIAGYVVVRGVAALNAAFFTKEPTAPGLSGGGIVQAFIGSAIMVGLAGRVSVPPGLLARGDLAQLRGSASAGG